MTITPVRSSARVGTLGFRYSGIVEKSYSDYIRFSEEIKTLGDVEYSESLEILELDSYNAGLQTIVFSAMTFEATIYDFAAMHLGDDYVRSYLDKLDLMSKWVIVLRLVSGVELRKGDAPYGTLKNLIVARNHLVHSKSSPFDFQNQTKQCESLMKSERLHEADVHNAFRALVLMSTYLDSEQSSYPNPLPSYSKDNASRRRGYKDLSEMIGKYRSTIM